MDGLKYLVALQGVWEKFLAQTLNMVIVTRYWILTVPQNH